MNKNRYKEIEKRLYDYFDRERKIDSLKYKIGIIKDQMKRINEENMDYYGYKSPSWNEKIQTSYNTESYASKELERFEQMKKQRIDNCIKEIFLIEETIRQIETNNAVIEYNISFLGKEAQKLLKLKYKDRKTETSIGYSLHLDQSAINKKKIAILSNISMWEEWGN